VTTLKVGTHSNDGPALFQAFLWWLGYPESLPRKDFPRNFGDAALECNRLRKSHLRFIRESYGYEFACGDPEAINTLNNVAAKARLAISRVNA
jgi:hypothetical protein